MAAALTRKDLLKAINQPNLAEQVSSGRRPGLLQTYATDGHIVLTAHTVSFQLET